MKIGVLSLQGSVVEHMNSFSRISGVTAFEVKTAQDLDDISGLVLPGGESTTIGKLLKDFGLNAPVITKAKSGMPLWGTCAGMILMAKEISNESCTHLGLMDISVSRNAYGSQLDSFTACACIPAISPKDIHLVFIRAPWIEKAGEAVNILATVNGRMVAAQQENMLATSFHPELTEDLSFHKYFADMCKSYREQY
ncbi:MAG: pyridoxal 5'-phosphate synthase glutaminase subunit PdxT [Ruminiclostridium sp.]|nr:pyridoxal 5'-phosphate synthase glutaminase subunit PdxT [Ruminiclostridium sp.]